MKTSADGLAFIAHQEGYEPDVYLDVAGIPTIGYGHVVRSGDPTHVTQEQAMTILGHDIASAESAVTSDVEVAITQNEFDALVSFTFNCGTGALAGSTLLRKVNDGDFPGAAAEFLRWDHAVVNGVRVEVADLKARRAAESAMFTGRLVG